MARHALKRIKLVRDNGHSESSEDIPQLGQDKPCPAAEPDIMALAAIRKPRFSLTHKELDRLPEPIHNAMVLILNRARDPLPEVSYISAQRGADSSTSTLGWLPVLTLISAFGMLSLAHAYTLARSGAEGGEWFFWSGLLLVVVPVAVRLISPAASQIERLALLCLASTCIFIIDVTARPFYFADYDAFVHWRTADDIARSGHLFGGNPLLPTSSFYPGLEIVTDALSKLSGLNTFDSGVIVIGVARLVMILSLFMLYEYITRSARVAGIAMILYMSNPHFLFFDALYSYESLALPLATLVLLATTYAQLKNERRQATVIAWATLSAVVVIHHMTDYLLDGFFVLWAIAFVFRGSARLYRSNLVKTALLGVLLSFAWIAIKGNPVVGYLFPYFSSALNELAHILTNSGHARQLFVSYSGQPTPPWERIVAITSEGLILLCLPFGLFCLWQRYRSIALARAFGIATIFYPLSQLFRLTTFGSEIADRATAFLFIPLGFVLAIFMVQFWPVRHLRWQQASILSCACTVVFLGGVILGSGPPWALLPGTYLVAADARSIEPEGIQAATWAYIRLGPNNRIATDRTNRLLMSTYGDQRVITGIADGIDITPVFFSLTIGPREIAILRLGQVQYLVVDRRLSMSLPSLGFYFEQGEPDSYHYKTPINLQALTKFNADPQINRVFDSGNIVIYDVGGLINAPEKP